MNNLHRADIARRYIERTMPMGPSREQMIEDIEALASDLLRLEAENQKLKDEVELAYDKGYVDALETVDEDTPYENGYEAGYDAGFDDGMEEAGHKSIGIGEPK